MLLDETYFPISEFQRADILSILQVLGLQTTLEWPGVIACAHSISNATTTATTSSIIQQRQQQQQQQQQDNNQDFNRLNRARKLLSFLDKNIARLNGLEAKKDSNRSIFSIINYFVPTESGFFNFILFYFNFITSYDIIFFI